jgi:methylated-DNA-protein-cysteine methyltransferase-like protein
MKVPRPRSPTPPQRAAPRTDHPAWASIYAVVRSIPRGRVATYGEVAALAGIASGHRVAARAMQSCPESLPWQRVVGKKDARRAQIAIGEPEHAALQRAMLESESVFFDENGFIPLKRSGWLATSGAAEDARSAKRARHAKKAVRGKRRAR